MIVLGIPTWLIADSVFMADAFGARLRKTVTVSQSQDDDMVYLISISISLELNLNNKL